ncbi:retrovirus-related pol polyprotein from transposon TNT 1-94 [Tanacetum coccineum]
MLCSEFRGKDPLTGSRDLNLYTIFISDMATSSPACLMYKAISTKSWLWHRQISHLNFGTINHLTKQDLVDGLPKFKYDKEHLCLACEQGKIKKAILKPKLVPSTHSKLEIIHMDLCGPTRVESINDKKYIMVIVDDYSCYTWVYFLRTKDEAPKMIIKFITQIHLNMQTLTSLSVILNHQEESEQNCLNFQDSSKDLTQTPTKEDLNNLFGPFYEEYYETRTLEVSTNSAATDTLNNEYTPLSSSIIVDDNEAPQIVSSSKEPIVDKLTTLVLDNIADESIQEDTTELDRNTFINIYGL